MIPARPPLRTYQYVEGFARCDRELIPSQFERDRARALCGHRVRFPYTSFPRKRESTAKRRRSLYTSSSIRARFTRYSSSESFEVARGDRNSGDAGRAAGD
jgi:hypothetical protein